MLKTIDECADRIEAARLGLCDSAFVNRANELRRGQIDLGALSDMKRNAERLLEGLRSVEAIVRAEQGRSSGDPVATCPTCGITVFKSSDAETDHCTAHKPTIGRKPR